MFKRISIPVIVFTLVIFVSTAHSSTKGGGGFDVEPLIDSIYKCGKDEQLQEVLVVFAEQVEFIDFNSRDHNAYVSNEDVRGFVDDVFNKITGHQSRCSDLVSFMDGLYRYIDHEMSKSGYPDGNDACAAYSESSRECVVNTKGLGGLNLRVVPGVVNSLTRLDGFKDGSTVSAVCTFGNWALVSGLAFESNEINFGWSHREYLDCEVELEIPGGGWTG